MTGMDGVLIVDKPAGMTSHDVVARVRKTIGERRAGHTGTLDPFATGVLVVLLGRATRLAQFLSGAEKEYEAVFRLGYATDTGDVTGARVETTFTAETGRTQSLDREEIEAAIASLRGEIDQIPPMYSAKKIAGRKLYELARRGEEVERKAERVTVSVFEAIAGNDALLKNNDDGSRDLRVRVVCSAGTYVRSLAESLGEQVGTGGHVAELRRTRAGRFRLENSVTLDRLGELRQSDSIKEILISPDVALRHLPHLELSDDDVKRTIHGIDIQVADTEASSWLNTQPVRICDSAGELVAVGIYDEPRKLIHPKVVIATE